jgi:cell division protein FtsB
MLGAVVMGLAFDGLCGASGPRDLLILRRHSRALIRRRDALLLDNAAFRERIARLRSDDAYLQRMIRQELGYVRPGELVYRFPKSEQP